MSQDTTYALRSGDRPTARNGLKTLASHAVLTREDLVRAEIKIPADYLPDGMYFFRIRLDDLETTRKIIIQH